jgi:predicted anti-sigma-YlaC factor YlaD
MTMPPPSAHLADLLSALLDGELTDAERTTADAHLAECALCRAELDATATARGLVRALPPVEPPFSFFERLHRAERRRRPAAWVAAVAGTAAVVVHALSPRDHTVAPTVGRFVEAHATASPGGDPVSNLGPPSVLPVSFQP